ncbi:hypothetical protein HK104_004651, partial [Borealophlyctis nickersoniae]
LERDEASARAEQAVKDKKRVEETLGRVVRKKEGEVAEVLCKSNKQIKSLREHYDAERTKLQSRIDELESAKIELQVEIGQLMRDKRAAEFDLNTIQERVESSRDQFKRDLGISVVGIEECRQVLDP